MCHIWGNNDRLYPNMFVMLVGPPAVGKQMPMKKAGLLIKSVKNTKVIEGSASIQAVIKTLGEYETGGMKGASGLIFSEEYASFHAGDTQNTNDLLTTLWDFHENWDRNLISWQASLKRVCVSLLGSSNEKLLKGVMDSRALFGGLLSRLVLVVENKQRHKSGMMRKNVPSGFVPERDFVEEKLKEHVLALSRMRGEITFEEDAMKEYEHWYEFQWEEENPRTQTGIEGRMKTHVKKVAMALAMSEWSLDPIVRKPHIEYAIELCTGLYKNYIVMAQESGNNPSGHPAALLIRYLATSPNYELRKQTILQRHMGDFNEEILGDAAKQLEQVNYLYIIEDGTSTSYRLTPECLAMYSLTRSNVAVK